MLLRNVSKEMWVFKLVLRMRGFFPIIGLVTSPPVVSLMLSLLNVGELSKLGLLVEFEVLSLLCD